MKKYKINLVVCQNDNEIATKAANMFADVIKNKAQAVLGLATGSSPVSTYAQLVKMYEAKAVSFKKVKTFNLDEYADLMKQYDHESYRNFMNAKLFHHVDIDLANTHFPTKEIPEAYDALIDQAGGIDIQLLGLGVNGHIAFNEPYTSKDSKTHIVAITDSTKNANARFFNDNKDHVPSFAITMGIDSIMKARKIVLIATGKNKAEAVSKMFIDQYDAAWPCSILMYHPDVTVFVDESAASLIKK